MFFLDTVFETFFSLFVGYDWLSLLLLSSVFILLVTLCFFFVLLFACCWFSNFFDKWVWYFLWLAPFICVCVEVCLRHWITYLRLLCFYVDITCVCLRLESISLKHFIFWMLCLIVMCSILGVLIFHFDILCLFLSYVVLSMLSVLNVRMLSICAYHGHGRLSHWQLFLNLCFSMLYCTFTILLHPTHCAL